MRKLALATLAITLTLGCHRGARHAESPHAGDALARLESPDADERKDAAEELRDDDGPPESAVPALLDAASKEKDEEALSEMLRTLGASGKDAARAPLERALADTREDVRKAAWDGLEEWAKKRGDEHPRWVPAIAALASPFAELRIRAAEQLGDDDGPPKEALAPLVAALAKEQNEKAAREMLDTLARSGAPEARAAIEGRVADPEEDVRRTAQKALKRWRAKNGEVVRGDVEAGAKPAEKGPAAAPPPDGCDQFKAICGADPFDVAKCKSAVGPLSYERKVVWADCINASSEPCQKAHETCLAKAQKTPGKP